MVQSADRGIKNGFDDAWRMLRRIPPLAQMILALRNKIVQRLRRFALPECVDQNELDFHFFGDKSFYVNTACLAAMLPTEFILQSGLRVPISRSYKKAAKESFLFGFGAILGKI